MRRTTRISRIVLCALLSLAGAAGTTCSAETPDKERDRATIACEMTFDLSGESAFHETANGFGIIRCDNGRLANLRIRTTGGGVRFWKSAVVDGAGTFSGVWTIDELFGSYVQSEVYADSGRPTAVQVLKKGRISLVLHGAGRGEDFGFTFDRVTIERARWATFAHGPRNDEHD